MGNCQRSDAKSSQKKLKYIKDKLKYFNTIQPNDAPLERDYQIYEFLGKGAYGKVVRALHIPSGEFRAVKIIITTNMCKKERNQILQEIKILSHLDHPNIVKIFEYFINPNSLYIVTDILTGGDLFDYLISENHLSEKSTALYMEQLLSAIRYVHERGVVHRDLKPENILCEKHKITIVDFGKSSSIKLNKKEVPK
jgi:serine/threonine protein kinase